MTRGHVVDQRTTQSTRHPDPRDRRYELIVLTKIAIRQEAGLLPDAALMLEALGFMPATRTRKADPLGRVR